MCFKEQAFSISGAVEGKDAIEVGKMLAASYIITGKIFELAGKLTVTFKPDFLFYQDGLLVKKN